MPVSKKTSMMRTQPARPGIKPYWQSECGRAVLYVGDCLDVMEGMDRDQFHAVVTDPPYGLEFMGKDWDAPWKSEGSVDARQHRAAEMSDPVKSKYLRHQVTYGSSNPQGFQQWFLARARAMLDVARPGAHLMSFGGTRMWHRMTCAVEDSGWEIRDTIMWLYGSGFPKGLDVSKAIDAALGVESTDTDRVSRSSSMGGTLHSANMGSGGFGYKNEWSVTEPVTDAARQWSGWNTALKPAHEPIVLARKPLTNSVAQNILDYGCGGLNIDGCRVGTTGGIVTKCVATKTSTGSGVYGFNTGEPGEATMSGGFSKTQKDGRHPANLIHDGSDEVVEMFPTTESDSGSAARFFYTAKAGGDRDRPHGKEAAIHPTVKPLDLMQYLVRLVCARGGTVLDPFCGSGSTGCAAILEGMHFVGIEKSQEYADLAVGKLILALQRAPEMVELTLHGSLRSGTQEDTPPPPRRLRG
jgi:DNA modification methylase